MATVTYHILGADGSHDQVKNKQSALARAGKIWESGVSVTVKTGSGKVVYEMTKPEPEFGPYADEDEDQDAPVDGRRNNPGRRGYLPFSQWAGYALLSRRVATEVFANPPDDMPSAMALKGNGKEIRQWVDGRIADVADTFDANSPEGTFWDHIWSFVDAGREQRAQYMFRLVRRYTKKAMVDLAEGREQVVCHDAFSLEGCGDCENGDPCDDADERIAESSAVFADEVVRVKR